MTYLQNKGHLALRDIRTISILFGFCLLSILWLGLYHVVHSERQTAVNEALYDTGNWARALEEHTLRIFKNADQTALLLKYAYEKDGPLLDLNQYIRAGIIADDRPLVLIYVIDETGSVTVSSKSPQISQKLNDREHFLVHQPGDNQKVYISKPMVARTSGQLVIQVSRRINKPDGSFGGVAVVSVDPHYFSRFYQQVDMGKGSTIVLIGRDLIIRARQTAEESHIGQKLSNSVLEAKLAVGDLGSYRAVSPVDGITRYYSYRALQSYPLVVSIGMDEQEVLRAVNLRVFGYYIVAGLVSLIVLGFIFVLLKNIKRQRVIERSLRQTHEDLEAQVRERTRQLSLANQDLRMINDTLEQEITERIEMELVLRHKEEELRSSQELLSMAAQLAHMAPWKYHPETELFELNDEFYAIYGTTVTEEGQFKSLPEYAKQFVHPDDVEMVAREIGKALAVPGNSSGQLNYRIIRRDGAVRTIAVFFVVNKDEAGKLVRHYGAIHDITEQVQHEATLRQQGELIRHLAYFDSLTGLPNRLHLNEWLAGEMERTRRGEATGVLLFIDLDDLKIVNDTFGHSCGDQIIIAAGKRILDAVGAEAFMARIGGDEFILALPGVGRDEASGIIRRILKALEEKYEFWGSHFHMMASIGVATYPADGTTPDEIVKNADNAMYAAKRQGKNCWRFYTASMQTEIYDKMRLTNSLRDALAKGELGLVYQPIRDIASGAVTGFEALLRWHSSEHGTVSPGRFIPLAEECGLIHPIGRWVLAEACQFARRLAANGWGELQVAVNISAKQLIDDDFIANVRQAIDRAGISPSQMELEITESGLLVSMEDATCKLNQLRGFGVHVSLDDFGTGYSSLTYLRNLPVGTLKIDKSFVDLIGVPGNGAKIIGSIIHMAHSLDMIVVAEGVETKEQVDYLADNACDRIQGYIFSQPLPEAALMNFLANRGR